MFDRLQQWPHIPRLHHWAALEREQPVDAEVAAYHQRVTTITAAQEAGRIRADIPAAELMAMVIAVVLSWDSASPSLKALQADFGSRDLPVAERRW